MSLTLAMLRCPDSVAPETRTVAGGEFSIGRGPENDWVLPDPERGLSKRHCVFAFRSGGWQIADTSTNGTFLNREAEPIGRGQARDLRAGDRLSFGAYEIEIHIEAEALSPHALAAPDPFAARRSAAPEMFALDPFAAASDRAGPGIATDPLLSGAQGGDPFAAHLGAAAVTLPPDFDPLAPDPEERGFRGPTQSDHTPHIEDAFIPAAARSVLPEDWDREMATPASARAPDPEPIHPTHAAPPPPSPESPFAEPVARQVPEPSPQPPPPRPIAAAPVTAAFPVVAPPIPAPPAAPPPVVPPPAAAAPQPRPADDLLAAFLRGSGGTDLRPADPVAAMEGIGSAFRAFVSGLRQAMIARAAVKGEFRIEQTTIRSRGNNPLKFSADDDDAMAALLGVGRRTDMTAADAVEDALRDIRQHELATVTAMQTAVRTLLAELEPAKVQASVEHGALTLLSAQRKANAWDAFEALHSRVSQALLDDFDSVFGKAFARAYERAVADIAAQEPRDP